MDGFDNLNSREFDTIFELILVVLFMSVGVFSIVTMVQHFNDRSSVYYNTDKIEVSGDLHEANDPFYFTGYQAYMFAWHMDEFSDVSLTWVGGDLVPTADGNVKASGRKEGLDPEDYITLCTLDENGRIRQGFITWRNRMITGSSQSFGVANTIRSIVPTADAAKLYMGRYQYGSAGRLLVYHLDITDDYINEYEQLRDPNNVIYEERKVYLWTLHPTLK